ncbi:MULTISPECIES: LuxR C-terminal-related transcriptional regulator [unclassified Aureimonas]|uniref:LuxR C-terminal-related transcriptional regulator n=1 Tax=Aureimonas sp. Leaf427 TaxID=1736375 RepID=UPI0007149339|nr:hypothetical protein ASG54_09400 [Aureimonas sp. Leaf460]
MDERAAERKRGLSEHEIHILQLLLSGEAEADVARRFGISSTAASSNLVAIYRKLGAQHPTHAVAVAIAEGIV